MLTLKWTVPEAGYEWIEGKEIDRKELAPGLYETEVPDRTTGNYTFFLVPKEGSRARSYAPLEDAPALYRQFGDRETTLESTLAFANEYGHLGGRGTRRVIWTRDNKVAMGEPVALWTEEIKSMQRAIRLWDSLRAGQLQALSDEFDKAPFVELEPGNVKYEPSAKEWQEPVAASFIAPPVEMSYYVSPPIETVSLEDRWEKYAGQRRIQMWALSEIQALVNNHISGRLSPTLAWSDETNSLQLRFVPDGLLSALWVQLAQAITLNKRYGQCAQCGAWFEISPRAARKNRVYCSNACKTRAFRERKQQTHRLDA